MVQALGADAWLRVGSFLPDFGALPVACKALRCVTHYGSYLGCGAATTAEYCVVCGRFFSVQVLGHSHVGDASILYWGDGGSYILDAKYLDVTCGNCHRAPKPGQRLSTNGRILPASESWSEENR